jgi:hypothetical protein
MPKITETPPVLLPYLSHGVDFVRENLSNQAIADCPFCGRENKFYVSEEDVTSTETPLPSSARFTSLGRGRKMD